jgi:Tfp pilus assembly protein PilO
MDKCYKKLDRFYLIGYSIWKDNRNFSMLAISGFFVFIASYFLYLSPLIKHKKAVYQQIIKLEKNLQVKQGSLADYRLCHKKLDLLKRQFFLDRNKYEKIKNGVFLSLISGQMLPEYLSVNYLKTYANKGTAFYSAFPIEVSMTGSKKSIVAFLYQLVNLRYPILIKQFHWSFFDKLDSDNKRKLTLLFIIYLDSLVLKHFLAMLPRNSMANLPVSSKAILARYSLNEMKMVGFLNEVFWGKTWGLVQLPDKKVYKITVHDILGLEKASIVLIDADKIISYVQDKKKYIELLIKSNKDL